MVGRRTEPALFLDRFDRAAGRRGGAVLVTGESGIGKTRPPAEVGTLVEESGGIVMRRSHRADGLGRRSHRPR